MTFDLLFEQLNVSILAQNLTNHISPEFRCSREL